MPRQRANKDLRYLRNHCLRGGYWSVTQSRHLRKLYPGYDDHRDTKYVVTEVSDLIISPPISNNHKEPQ